MQGHSQQLPHTLYSSYWLTVLWRPSFSLLSGRFLLFVCFVCEEKKKGECVHVCYAAMSVWQSQTKKNVACSVYHLSYQHIAKGDKQWLFYYFFSASLEVNRTKLSLIPALITYFSCRMHKLSRSLVYKYWTVCVSLNIFTLKEILNFQILPPIEQTVQNLNLELGNL